MSSSASMLSEKPFQCSICLHVFTDPVTTPCGHNFCQSCLRGVWDDSHVCHCPTCEKSFTPRPEISINTAFKELADMFRKASVTLSAPPPSPAKPGEVVCDVCAGTGLQLKAMKSCLVCLTSYCEAHLDPHHRTSTLKLHKLIEPVNNLQDRMCTKHGKLLSMFCRLEQTCVCQFCAETQHKDHQLVTIEEESAEIKAKMKDTEAEFQQMIEERLKKVEEMKESMQLSRVSREEEMQKSERLFTSLIHAVQGRQAEVQKEIKEKQEAAERRSEELIGELELELSALQRRNSELDQLKNSDDHLYVLQRVPSVTSLPPSREWAEIKIYSDLCTGTVRTALSQLDDTLKKELDSVKTDELKRLKKYVVDIVLDPDTAHPNIDLSPDGKQAGRGELMRIIPDIPQRFNPVICVLGKRGFLTGRIYFEVSVGTKTYWDIGVVRESVNRKGRITSTPENGYWTVRLRNGEEYRALDSPSVPLALKERPLTVGVFMDYEGGTVSFFNVEASSHIYTYDGYSFTERMFPFFSPGVCDEGKNTAPLVILPVNQDM
ncbi:E3 ubiquitin-protein ligase TRIM39-like [Thalassophryne amazonica]|uniref:E3 ubiquitin-protein ligase TRIM39-like n=1 Tax=Thalassophryne amazonica TaxID=390379 RepID=UPI0014718994|nr:E3 ubiquitin-protein ligase TRIM39-like [Thalassophryne amazonica]